MYMTIVLELLQQRPGISGPLRKERKLLATVELHASELKSSQEAWKERLARVKPGSDPSQIASEAMELAIKQLEDRLPRASAPYDSQALSLDEAIRLIRSHTPSD